MTKADIAKKYKGLTQNERINALKRDAANQYEKLMKRDLTQEDLDEMKSRLSEIDIALNDMALQKKELIAPIDIRIKEFKEQHRVLLIDLKNKFYEENETVFDLEDHDEGVMHTIDIHGDIIDTRSLTPQEKQSRIKVMMRNNTIKEISQSED